MEKINTVIALIKEHNKLMQDVTQDDLKIDVELFKRKLSLIGGTSDERCKGLSHEEITECFVPIDGIYPKLLIKEIAKIFRGKEDSGYATSNSSLKEKKYLSSKDVSKMSTRELVENYSVDESESNVTKRLKEISKGMKCVVFKNKLPDVEKTFLLIQEIIKNYPERKFFVEGNEVYETYKIGDNPYDLVDENPIYVNRPLRLDESCDQTGRSWNGVSTEIRQFVRLISVTIGNVNLETAHKLIDYAISADPIKTLSMYYPAAKLEFNRLKDSGDLPKLKISLSNKVPSFYKNINNGTKVKIKKN